MPRFRACCLSEPLPPTPGTNLHCELPVARPDRKRTRSATSPWCRKRVRRSCPSRCGTHRGLPQCRRCITSNSDWTLEVAPTNWIARLLPLSTIGTARIRPCYRTLPHSRNIFSMIQPLPAGTAEFPQLAKSFDISVLRCCSQQDPRLFTISRDAISRQVMLRKSSLCRTITLPQR
jgi:hypothetical protein